VPAARDIVSSFLIHAGALSGRPSNPGNATATVRPCNRHIAPSRPRKLRSASSRTTSIRRPEYSLACRRAFARTDTRNARARRGRYSQVRRTRGTDQLSLRGRHWHQKRKCSQLGRRGKLNAMVFQVGAPEVPAERAWAESLNATSQAVLEDFIKR
jgi:hypothetical protein